MKPYRPPAVLVMAILNMVFGGIGMMSICLGIGGMVVMYLVFRNLPQPPPGQPNPMADVFGMFDVIPGYFIFASASLIVGSVFTVVLFVSGIGLLGMRTWARWGSIVYASYSILSGIVGAVYTIVVVNPAMVQWYKNHPNNPAGAMYKDTTILDIIAVVSVLIAMAYPVALLIVLFLPGVVRAFAGEVPPEFRDERGFTDEEPEEGEDYGETDDRGRGPTY